MDKKYLLIGGIALFAVWWFYIRKKDVVDDNTADDQPERPAEAEEEESTNTTTNYAQRNNNGTGITAEPIINVNRTGTGDRSNTGSGNNRITVAPIVYNYAAKTITLNE